MNGKTRVKAAGVVSAVGIVVAVVLLFYLRTAWFAFAYDDHMQIEWNRFLQDPRNVHQLWPWRYIRLPGFPDQNRPLLVASLFFDRWLGGDSPVVYHLQNVFWHLITSVLVLALAFRIGLARTPAILAGVLFAIHPIHAEAVAAISNREDPLAGCFSLAALLLAHEALAAPRLISFSGVGALLGVAVTLELALLGKEAAVVTPALLVLVLLFVPSWRPACSRARALARYGALAVAFVVAIGAWTYFQGELGYPSLLPGAGGTGLERAAAALDLAQPPEREAPAAAGLSLEALLDPAGPGARRQYPGIGARHILSIQPYRLGQLLVPIKLSALYDLTPFQRLPALVFGAILVVLLGWLFVAAFKRAPLLAFGLGWFAISTGPVGIPSILLNPLADRYLYLPAVGVCVALAWALSVWLPARTVRISRGFVPAAAAALLFFFAVRNWQQVGTWRNDREVFTNAVRVAPQSAFAYQGLGLGRVTAGDTRGAREAWERAIELDPDFLVAHMNLGRLAEQEGRIDDAIEHYRRGTETLPIVAEQAMYDQVQARLEFLLSRQDRSR